MTTEPKITGIEGIEQEQSISAELWEPAPGEMKYIYITGFDINEGDRGLYMVMYGFDIATEEYIVVPVAGILAWTFNRHIIDIADSIKLIYKGQIDMKSGDRAKQYNVTKVVLKEGHSILDKPIPEDAKTFESCYEILQEDRIKRNPEPKPKTRRKKAASTRPPHGAMGQGTKDNGAEKDPKKDPTAGTGEDARPEIPKDDPIGEHARKAENKSKK